MSEVLFWVGFTIVFLAALAAFVYGCYVIMGGPELAAEMDRLKQKEAELVRKMRQQETETPERRRERQQIDLMGTLGLVAGNSDWSAALYMELHRGQMRERYGEEI